MVGINNHRLGKDLEKPHGEGGGGGGGGGGKCTFEYVQDMRFSNNLDVYLSNSFSKFKPRKISRNRLPKLKCAKFYVMAVFKMSLY